MCASEPRQQTNSAQRPDRDDARQAHQLVQGTMTGCGDAPDEPRLWSTSICDLLTMSSSRAHCTAREPKGDICIISKSICSVH